MRNCRRNRKYKLKNMKKWNNNRMIKLRKYSNKFKNVNKYNKLLSQLTNPHNRKHRQNSIILLTKRINTIINYNYANLINLLLKRTKRNTK